MITLWNKRQAKRMPMLFLQTIETAITGRLSANGRDAGWGRISVSCWALQRINVGRPSWRHDVPTFWGRAC